MESANNTIALRTIVSPLFLFCSIGLTIIAMIIIIYINVTPFSTSDAYIDLHHFSTERLKKFGGDPAMVEIGLYINDFDEFDVNNDNFVFNGIVTFEFDPSLISSKTLENIGFERGEILYKSTPTSLLEQGRMFIRYTIKVKFSGYLDYKKFPFEDHRIPLVLVHKMLTPADLIFQTKNEDFIAPDMSSVGWRKYATRAEAGFLETKLDTGPIFYPAVVFSIDYGHDTNFRNIFTVLLPMLILFFISQFSLILNPLEEFTFIIAIPVQAIAGVIAYRFVIESISPKSGYFMCSDYFFFLFLLLMFGILLFHALGRKTTSWVRKAIIVGLNSIVILFLYFLTY